MVSEPEPEHRVLVDHPRDDPPLSSVISVQKDVAEDRETEGRHPQGPDTLVVLEFNPASKSELCHMWHFFAFGVSISNSRTEISSGSLN